MLMYKTAVVQTHSLFAGAYKYHMKSTHTHTHTCTDTHNDIQNLTQNIENSHTSKGQNNEWLLFVVSNKKSAVQISLVFVK